MQRHPKVCRLQVWIRSRGNFNPDPDAKMREQKSAASRDRRWRRRRRRRRHHWEMLSDAEAIPQLNTVGELLSWKQGGKACSSQRYIRTTSSTPPFLRSRHRARAGSWTPTCSSASCSPTQRQDGWCRYTGEQFILAAWSEPVITVWAAQMGPQDDNDALC